MVLPQAIVEIARVDASFSTFLMVHNYLGMLTIGLLGSERQKVEFLPGMANLQRIGAWALTEPSNGSDASGLETSAEWLISGGVNGRGVWRLNGQKRWIGNATFADVIIIWARDTSSGRVREQLRGPTALSAVPCEPCGCRRPGPHWRATSLAILLVAVTLCLLLTLALLSAFVGRPPASC